MKKLILFLAMIVCASTAHGNAIAVDTFAPGNTYDQHNSSTIGRPNTTVFQVFGFAMQFTPLASGNLETVDLGLTFETQAGPAIAFLYGDASGMPDNSNRTFLGTATPTDRFGSTNNSVVSVPVGGTVPLDSGTTYWLALMPNNSSVDDVWNLSSTEGGILADTLDGGTTWFSTSVTRIAAFRLTVSSVPDAGNTSLLFFCALSAVIMVSFCKHTQIAVH